jgi:hypothetical protein
MPLDPQHDVHLTEAQGRMLGRVSIQRIEGNRVFGSFAPEADYASVRAVFKALEEAANDQLFDEADRLSQQIDRFGLRLLGANAAEQLIVCDVQIMNGRDLCCRIPNLALTQLPRAVA